MRLKKFICAAMALVLLLGLAACGSKAENKPGKDDTAADATVIVAPSAENSLGAQYRDAFLASTAADAAGKVQALIDANIYEGLVDMEVEPGWLEGCTEDVTGFSKGVRFSPMIGSIPFIGYVLESDDAAALGNSLKELADPRWNICTEADETVILVSGNLVFFLMCPSEL
ncbi:MAG: hypothetical protein MJ075_05870 [Oscillospiraceae bacterium]|nr:hypothetical protein [Oscillospiraceae bacterium]